MLDETKDAVNASIDPQITAFSLNTIDYVLDTKTCSDCTALYTQYDSVVITKFDGLDIFKTSIMETTDDNKTSILAKYVAIDTKITETCTDLASLISTSKTYKTTLNTNISNLKTAIDTAITSYKTDIIAEYNKSSVAITNAISITKSDLESLMSVNQNQLTDS